MTDVIVAIEAMGVIVLLITLYGLVFESRIRDRKNKLFIACIVITQIALVSDIVSWHYDGVPELLPLLKISNLLAMVLGLFIMLMFIFYLREIVNGKRRVRGMKMLSAWAVHIPAVINVLAAVFFTYQYFTGGVYVIEGGLFIPSDWYSLTFFITGISMVYEMILILGNLKTLGRHDGIALSLYVLIPAAAAMVEMLNTELSLSLTAVAVAELLLYVTLQAGRMQELHVQGRVLGELVNTDSLTGLQNRRAYDLALERMSREEVLGVAFCDLNRLKFINDTQGHKAGDDLIREFAKLMRAHFSPDSLFRISGDEFVIIVPRLDKLSFSQRMMTLNNANEERDYLGSIGSAYGEGERVLQLVNAAEAAMYKEKELFHATHPEYDRK